METFVPTMEIEHKEAFVFESLKSMKEVLKGESISLDSYLVPKDMLVSVNKVTKLQKESLMKSILAFNGMLCRIAEGDVRMGPFTVYIIVGNLKGFGDITAEAKLAAELSLFYQNHTDFRAVSVKLILIKIRNSGAELLETVHEDATPKVLLGYSAHNVMGVVRVMALWVRSCRRGCRLSRLSQ